MHLSIKAKLVTDNVTDQYIVKKSPDLFAATYQQQNSILNLLMC